MKTKLFQLMVITTFLFSSCDDGFKSSTNDNTTDSTLPDEQDRHLSDDEIYDHQGKLPKENPDSTKMEKDRTATGHDSH